MNVRFWGVRGSTPTPQKESMGYGGNTSCVEIRTEGDEIVILDGGTGIRLLGKKLQQEFNGRPIKGHIFFSHFHLDHIQGIPFFRPLYDARNHFTFYFADTRDPQVVPNALAGLMANPYFPVDISNLPCSRDHVNLVEGTLDVAGMRIQVLPLNHPQRCFGFRITHNGKVLAYCTDVELGTAWSDENVRTLGRDADLFIVDSQFTPDELSNHVGWGHSSWKQAIDIGVEAHAKRVVLFHHDPNHEDSLVDEILENARKCHPDVVAAREGLELTI